MFYAFLLKVGGRDKELQWCEKDWWSEGDVNSLDKQDRGTVHKLNDIEPGPE